MARREERAYREYVSASNAASPGVPNAAAALGWRRDAPPGSYVANYAVRPPVSSWRSSLEQRLPEIVGQLKQILIVFLADVLGELAAGSPADVPRRAPRHGVGAGIVDRDLVMKRFLVAPREL